MPLGTSLPMQSKGEQRFAFGPLFVAFDERVLRPRTWTVMQSEWAAELSPDLPPGPILELYAGAGQIGILAAVLSGRALVQVERDEVAAGFAHANAVAAGIAGRTEIRCAPVDGALSAAETFGLIIADPPYLPARDVDRFPEDPITAIDGGEDGLVLVRSCLDVIRHHLAPGGACLLQLAGPRQVARVSTLVDDEWPTLRVETHRAVDPERAVALVQARMDAAL